MYLAKFTDDECADIYRVHRHLPDGYDNITQVCYGDRNVARDTCSVSLIYLPHTAGKQAHVAIHIGLSVAYACLHCES